MSDNKEPKLSEIRARVEQSHNIPCTGFETRLANDNDYLLKLVSRLGKALGDHRCEACEQYYSNSLPPLEDCEFCQEARALLEEIKK